MKIRLLAVTIFAAFILIGGAAVYREGTLPVNRSSKETKIFVVKKGDGLNDISNNLAAEGLIRNRLVFYLMVRQKDADKKLQAGDFRLSPSMSTDEIIATLQHGTLDTWITVVEGLRKEEVAEIVSRNFKISETEFNKLADEGYLFPDTYLIPTDASSETVISIMKTNFEMKYAPLREKARRLNLTDEQVVILASLVEREAKFAADRPQVAGIMLKRLEEGMALQIDATVQYLLGYQAKAKTWWKKDLTFDDLAIDSPYNTRKNPGLPPGPICSPGLSSLEAVVNADKNTPYLFYLSEDSGRMHYARTLAEHEANITKYLR